MKKAKSQCNVDVANVTVEVVTRGGNPQRIPLWEGIDHRSATRFLLCCLAPRRHPRDIVVDVEGDGPGLDELHEAERRPPVPAAREPEDVLGEVLLVVLGAGGHIEMTAGVRGSMSKGFRGFDAEP